MQPNIDDAIKTAYLTLGNIKEKPFLDHLKFFEENWKEGDKSITATSIGEILSVLTDEWRIATYLKGFAIIESANKNGNYCPYKSNFDSSTLLKDLKHPCDTGIVMSDGSIDSYVLSKFIKENFVYDTNIKTYMIPETVLCANLEKFAQRDAHLEDGKQWISYKTLAGLEWKSFFDTFSDHLIANNLNIIKAVTLRTFMQFYYDPLTLYKRALDGEFKH